MVGIPILIAKFRFQTCRSRGQFFRQLLTLYGYEFKGKSERGAKRELFRSQMDYGVDRWQKVS